MLANDARAVNDHSGPVRREVIQNRLQGGGQGISEHGNLIGKILGEAHQPMGVSRHELGHAAPCFPVEAHEDAGGQVSLSEVLAQVIGTFGTKTTGPQAPQVAGQERLHRDSVPGAPC